MSQAERLSDTYPVAEVDGVPASLVETPEGAVTVVNGADIAGGFLPGWPDKAAAWAAERGALLHDTEHGWGDAVHEALGRGFPLVVVRELS